MNDTSLIPKISWEIFLTKFTFQWVFSFKENFEMLSQSNFKSHKLQGIRCCSLPVLFYMQQKSVFWGYLCSHLLNSNRFFHSAWTQIFTESTVTIWTLKMFNGLKRHVFSCFLQMLQEENIFFSWMLKTWDLSFHSKKM